MNAYIYTYIHIYVHQYIHTYIHASLRTFRDDNDMLSVQVSWWGHGGPIGAHYMNYEWGDAVSTPVDYRKLHGGSLIISGEAMIPQSGQLPASTTVPSRHGDGLM